MFHKETEGEYAEIVISALEHLLGVCIFAKEEAIQIKFHKKLVEKAIDNQKETGLENEISLKTASNRLKEETQSKKHLSKQPAFLDPRKSVTLVRIFRILRRLALNDAFSSEAILETNILPFLCEHSSILFSPSNSKIAQEIFRFFEALLIASQIETVDKITQIQNGKHNLIALLLKELATQQVKL